MATMRAGQEESRQFSIRSRMKPALPTALAALLLIPLIAPHAAELYVSPNGNDADPGTKERPFRTIQKAAEVMQPGDDCFIRAGTYRETVRPKLSGQPGKPLRFRAYEKELVVLSGADLLAANWSVHDGKIYKAATDRKFIQLFADGKLMFEARWPNSPLNDLMAMQRAAAGPGTDYETLADPKLPAGDWNGALVLIWPGSRWSNSTRRIVDYVPGKGFRFDRTLRRTQADPYHQSDPYQPIAGNPYVLFGSLAGLDSPGEWFLDEAKGIVYLWPVGGSSPVAQTVEVKQRDCAINLSGRDHIEVRGLRVFAAGINLKDARECLIENCDVRYPDCLREIGGRMADPANVMTGRSNEWRHCSIVGSATSALLIGGQTNRLINSIVHDANYLGTYKGALDLQRAVGAEVRQCTLYRAGRDIIQHHGSRRIRIEFNDLYYANLLNNDAAATYAWGTDGEGSVLAYNWVHDNTGESCNGIYLDNFCRNFVVHHNVIWNNRYCGIRLNSDALNHLICNNTITRNGSPFGVFTYHGRTPTQKDTRLINNLIPGRLRTNDPQVFVQGELGPALSHNGGYPMDTRGVPTAGSGAIDAGLVMPGITDGFHGKAPDIGAYEFGGKYWTAGADWKDAAATASPPMNLQFTPRPPLDEAHMITEGLQLWLDAADPRSIERDASNRLRRWKDKSGMDHHATLDGAEGAFVWQANALNGKPVVNGAGTGRLQVGTLRSTPGPLTAFVVSRATNGAGPSWQRIIAANSGSGREWETPNWMVLRPGGAKPAAYAPDVFIVKRASGLMLANVVVGGASAAKTQFLAGDLAEVILFDRSLPEADEDAILDYLTRKWGLK